jgi:hypothetical protein
MRGHCGLWSRPIHFILSFNQSLIDSLPPAGTCSSVLLAPRGCMPVCWSDCWSGLSPPIRLQASAPPDIRLDISAFQAAEEGTAEERLQASAPLLNP